MHLTKTEEAAFRRMAGAERCPVVVLPGDSPPRRSGERAYHTFKNSTTVVAHPGSALRAGHKLDYHPSTYRVTVGAEWVARRRAEKEWARKNRRRARSFEELGGRLGG